MLHGVGEVSQFRSRDAAGRAADVDDLVKRDVATVVCVDLLEHLPNDRHTLLRLGAFVRLVHLATNMDRNDFGFSVNIVCSGLL